MPPDPIPAPSASRVTVARYPRCLFCCWRRGLPCFDCTNPPPRRPLRYRSRIPQPPPPKPTHPHKGGGRPIDKRAVIRQYLDDVEARIDASPVLRKAPHAILAEVMKAIDPESFGGRPAPEKPLPAEPCPFPVDSPQRIETYRCRVAAGEQRDHPDDSRERVGGAPNPKAIDRRARGVFRRGPGWRVRLRHDDVVYVARTVPTRSEAERILAALRAALDDGDTTDWEREYGVRKRAGGTTARA